MDMATLNSLAEQEEEAVILPIFQKNGEPVVGLDDKQATISVVGSDSKRVRTEERAATRRQIQGARAQVTAESLYDNRIRLAAASVVAWSGWEHEGEPWPCTPDNVRALLGVPFILRQVEEGVSGHAGFFETPSTSS